MSAEMIGAELQPIQESFDPLASTRRADVSFIAQKKKLLWPEWIIQVYIFDAGDSRTVELIAVGDSGFGVAMNGRRNTVPLAKSLQKVNLIADRLR